MHDGCVYVMTKHNKENLIRINWKPFKHAAILSTIRKHILIFACIKIEPISQKKLPYVYIILKCKIIVLTLNKTSTYKLKQAKNLENAAKYVLGWVLLNFYALNCA